MIIIGFNTSEHCQLLPGKSPALEASMSHSHPTEPFPVPLSSPPDLRLAFSLLLLSFSSFLPFFLELTVTYTDTQNSSTLQDS